MRHAYLEKYIRLLQGRASFGCIDQVKLGLDFILGLCRESSQNKRSVRNILAYECTDQELSNGI